MGVQQLLLKAERITGKLGGQLVPLVHVMLALDICDPKQLFWSKL